MTDYLLSLYNKICEKAYEDHPDTDYESPEFEAVLEGCQQEWANFLLPDSTESVSEKIATYDFSEIVDLFEDFCKSDFPMPMAILTALNRFEEQTGDYLIKYAINISEGKNQPDTELGIQAAKALGRLQMTRYIPLLVSTVESLPSYEDLLIESVAEGLLNMGKPAIDPIMESINKAEKINNNMEYLLQVLSQLGKNHKSPEIFACLKSSFLRMQNKDLGALCIAEYNDVRGIAFLRSWLERHQKELSRETYFEILHCIKALGGQVDLF